MKRYRVFLQDGHTFDVTAERVSSTEDAVSFYVKEELTAQFSKQFIAGWCEMKK